MSYATSVSLRYRTNLSSSTALTYVFPFRRFRLLLLDPGDESMGEHDDINGGTGCGDGGNRIRPPP